MTDISRERCERLAHNLRGDWYEATAEIIIALRAALDAAEARERQAVEAERERCAEFLEDAANDIPLGIVGAKVRQLLRHEAGGIRKGLHRAAIRTGAKP